MHSHGAHYEHIRGRAPNRHPGSAGCSPAFSSLSGRHPPAQRRRGHCEQRGGKRLRSPPRANCPRRGAGAPECPGTRPSAHVEGWQRTMEDRPGESPFLAMAPFGRSRSHYTQVGSAPGDPDSIRTAELRRTPRTSVYSIYFRTSSRILGPVPLPRLLSVSG